MTTPAMPELPEPEGFMDQTLGGEPAFTADQMRAYALAALSQPSPELAGVSDEEIRDALEAEFLGEAPNRVWEDDLRIARAILALRPAQQSAQQAVPMTEEQAKQFLKRSDLLDMFLHIGWYSAPRKSFDEHALSLIRAVERFHRIGITAQGAQEGV